MDKQGYREQVKKKIAKLSPKHREQQDARVNARVCDLIEQRNPHEVLLYVALPDEVDLTATIMSCLEQGRCVLLPKVREDMQMDIYRIHSLQECTVGEYGIGEPDPAKATLWESGISFGVIPCRVVDMFGGRIGRGKGYYDRFFAGFPQMQRVGVAHTQQCVEQVPMDMHDVPLHQVIVE